MSVLLTHLKRFAEAEPYIKSTELNPNSDATLYNYGIIRKSLNRPAEALERLSHALSTNPNVAETRNSRGTILNELSRHDKALAHFDKATEPEPNNAEAFYNKGMSLAELGRYGNALAGFCVPNKFYNPADLLRPQVSVSLIKQEEPKRTCQPFRAKASASVLAGGRLAAGQLAYIDELASPKMQMG